MDITISLLLRKQQCHDVQLVATTSPFTKVYNHNCFRSDIRNNICDVTMKVIGLNYYCRWLRHGHCSMLVLHSNSRMRQFCCYIIVAMARAIIPNVHSGELRLLVCCKPLFDQFDQYQATRQCPLLQWHQQLQCIMAESFVPPAVALLPKFDCD